MAGKIRAALALPARGAWRRLAIEAAWSLPRALLFLTTGGLAAPALVEDPGLLVRLALVAPALGEEPLFRVLLLPGAGAAPSSRRVALSVLLFVLWHPPQVLLFGSHWAAVMLNPGFLAGVAVMRLALAQLYLSTGSVWPGVLLHWTAVVGWKACFGAPSPWIAT